MKTSQFFQKIFEAGLSDSELEIFELLEESFISITPENSSDYIMIGDYFESIKALLLHKPLITSNDIKIYIKDFLLKNTNPDLLFLDGLNSLAECLLKYGGKDDLNSFEIWLNERMVSLHLDNSDFFS